MRGTEDDSGAEYIPGGRRKVLLLRKVKKLSHRGKKFAHQKEEMKMASIFRQALSIRRKNGSVKGEETPILKEIACHNHRL